MRTPLNGSTLADDDRNGPGAPGAAPATPATHGAQRHTLFPRPIEHGWACVTTPARACASPLDLPADGWIPALVPGTVASARRAAGRLDAEHPPRFDLDDHWYRVTLSGTGPRRLRVNGLATIAEVWLDDRRLLVSDSMFVAHDVDIVLDGDATLALCFRSLAGALASPLSRARWRPRVAQPAALRGVRTTQLGHMPGWCPALEAVGPWRSVELLGEAPLAIDSVDLEACVDGRDGVVPVTIRFVHPQPAMPAATLAGAGASVPLRWQDEHTLAGVLRVPHLELWWPHTHGTPALHALSLHLAEHVVDLGRVGFRTIDALRGDDGEGFGLRINGVPVFCRGACWTSADLATLAGTPEQIAHAFALARDAGMNMLRVGGTMVYESDTFYRLADEFGILIWQDFAFANFDYPTHPDFAASIAREAAQFLSRTRRFASLAVLCGGSEVDQQAAMLGLPPTLREQPLFTEQLPAIAARERPDVPYVENSPTGGVWPFSTRTGVTHYYGVGAYQRPLDDVRRAEVRFAAECLAFANVPDDATLADAHCATLLHDPRWKAAVPRDPGAGWDFDDVRDHYLRTLYGIEPATLRYEDPQHYLDLSRAIVAELMTDVFAEWRRSGSSCRGGLVWQFQDLRAGAGWGIVDALGRPKSAWHALSRVCQPVQVVVTDEGLNGLDMHLVNETPKPLSLQLELVCLRDGAVSVVSVKRAVELMPRSTTRVSAADCLGRFFDFAYAYRFGPPAHDVTLVTLRDPADGVIVSESVHLPDRRALQRHDLGLSAMLEAAPDGWHLIVESKRFARFVHVVDARFRARDDWLHLPPGRPVRVALLPLEADDASAMPSGEVRAINALAPVFYG